MKLIVLEGPAARPEFEILERTALIGRAPDCDVMVFDAQVSRHHAQIVCVGDDDFVVESLQETNPTIVNDRYLTGRRRLRDGDLLVMGGMVLEVEIEKVTKGKGWEPPSSADAASEADTVPREVAEAARDRLRALASRFADAGRRFEVRAAPPARAGAVGDGTALDALLAEHEALGGDAELARLAELLSERLGNQTDIRALYRLGADTTALIAWTRIAQRSMAEARRLSESLGVR